MRRLELLCLVIFSRCKRKEQYSGWYGAVSDSLPLHSNRIIWMNILTNWANKTTNLQCIHQGTNFSASFRQILFLWYFLKRKMCSFLDQTIVLNKFWQKLLVFDSLSTNTQLKYPALFPAETCGEVGSLLYTHARQQTLTITCAHTCMTYDKFRSTRRTTKNQLSKWNSPYLSQSIFAFNRMPFKDMMYTNAMGVVRSL